MTWDWPQRIGGINLRVREAKRVGASDNGGSTGDWLRRDVLQEIARAGELPAAGASVVKQQEVDWAARTPVQSAADTSPVQEMEQRRIASQMSDSSGQLEQRLCALEARSAGFELKLRDRLSQHAEDLALLKQDAARQSVSIANLLPAIEMLAKKLATIRESAGAGAMALKSQFDAINERLSAADASAADLARIKAQLGEQAQLAKDVQQAFTGLAADFLTMRGDANANAEKLDGRISVFDERLRAVESCATDQTVVAQKFGSLEQRLTVSDSSMRDALSQLGVQLSLAEAKLERQANAVASMAACLEVLPARIGVIRENAKAETAALDARITALDECLRALERGDTGKTMPIDELGNLKRQLAALDAHMREEISRLKDDITRVKVNSAAQAIFPAAGVSPALSEASQQDRHHWNARRAFGIVLDVTMGPLEALRRPRIGQPVPPVSQMACVAPKPKPNLQSGRWHRNSPGHNKDYLRGVGQAAQMSLESREQKKQQFLRIATLSIWLVTGAMTDFHLFRPTSGLMDLRHGAAFADSAVRSAAQAPRRSH